MIFGNKIQEHATTIQLALLSYIFIARDTPLVHICGIGSYGHLAIRTIQRLTINLCEGRWYLCIWSLSHEPRSQAGLWGKRRATQGPEASQTSSPINLLLVFHFTEVNLPLTEGVKCVTASNCHPLTTIGLSSRVHNSLSSFSSPSSSLS